MNNKKSRSSLKKAIKDEEEAVRPPRRRISFSGKKFIREFDTTEKARDYDNSYEISDHTNGDDSSGQSHVTAGATSCIQFSSAHISLAHDMDKENTPLANIRESISTEYDQLQRTENTLQLQTSVNVTLMPHELAKTRQRSSLSVPLDSMAFDSLSLSDVERDRLRESSTFKIPVNEKTMDLMPQKMIYNEVVSETLEKESVQKTIIMPTDMSCVKEKDVGQKTVFFENNDITCDFSDIEPRQVIATATAATTEQTTFETFKMEERDSLNYLPDDDSISSPLIPLDVISENGISRKLNFLQLNEALNSGRIQLFPNGPRTPTADRNVKQRRFWNGIEQSPSETVDVPLRKAIKPRGTLNFNESPVPQQSQAAKEHLEKPNAVNKLPDVAHNNRFSQADEQMLDNTNFLAHAKMGDETQSRNSSKSASRRETTYDTTAMELDDLEKQEAAVAAALEKATRRPILQRIPAEDYPFDEGDKQRLSQTVQLNETVEEECLQQPAQKTEEKPITAAMDQNYMIRRQTLHLTEAIDPDIQSPPKDMHTNELVPQERRRQTLHFSEDIDEEMPSPQNNVLASKVQKNRLRQTLHLAEPIEEDSVMARSDGQKTQADAIDENTLKALPRAADTEHKGCRRQTLHFPEDMEEDRRSPFNLIAPPTSEQQTNRRRQTLHMAESIEEDLHETCMELKSVQANSSENKQWKRHRQTIQMAEPIEEEDIAKATKDLKTNPAAAAEARRQTLHFSVDMEEEIIRSEPANTTVKYGNNRRGTLHLAEPIETEPMRPQEEIKVRSVVPLVEEQSKRRRQTVQMAEPIEEDEIKSEPTPVPVAHNTEAINEDMLSPSNNSMAPKVEKQISRRRLTVHTAEPIEEDLVVQEKELKAQPVALAEEQHRRYHSQTMQTPEPIEEDVYKANPTTPAIKQELSIHRKTLKYSVDIEEEIGSSQQEMQFNSVDPSMKQSGNRRRQTVHMTELIEEDSFSTNNEFMAMPTESRRKHQQTMHLREEMEEEPVQKSHTAELEENLKELKMEPNSNLRADENTKHKSKSRQTNHLIESMEDDIFSDAPTVKKEDTKHRQTLVMSEAIKDDLSCFELASLTPPTNPTKSRQTLTIPVNIDQNMSIAPPTEKRRSSKPRMTFLEAFETDSNSPSLDKNTENSSQESQSDSAKWLAQMNAKLRKTLVNPNKDEDRKSILNPAVANRTSLETPKSYKTQRGYFPITPGRSMIEYEDLEEMCNIENPIETGTAQTICQPEAMELDMDMDISSYGTPIAATKSSILVNSKRLPIHLTPNLPQPKKRNPELPIKQEDQSASLRLDASRRDEEELTPTTRNRSRIPVLCKTFNSNSPWQQAEAEHLDGTVQMVRAQMMHQTRSLFDADTIYPMEHKQQLETTTKPMYEDNPITISDVSSHFAAQKQLAKQSLVNTTEDPRNSSSNSRSSNENSNKSYARAHKKFINLSGDTVIFDAAEIIDLASDDNEIDKTRLSLVETLLDEEEESMQLEAVPAFATETEPEQEEPDVCLEQRNPPAVAGAEDACKKCKHCRRSIDASETFVLPDWNALEEGLERLQRLRQHPRLEDVHKYWELKKLERYSNASDNNVSESSLDTNETEERLTVSEMLALFNKKLEAQKKALPKPEAVKTFVEQLTEELSNKSPNWLFDAELQCDRQYIISHKKISTFRIVIYYEPLDIMETKIRVCSIKAMTATRIPEPYWTVYEHLMDFQVRLRLPLNLSILLDGNDIPDMVTFLQHVDTMCLKTTKICNNMHQLLFSKQARLLRQRNRTVARKTVRKMFQVTDEAYMRVEKTDFLVEIGNIREISFKDIIQPPLYEFDEKIQFLPKGVAFLEAFFENPEQYLKPKQ